MFIPSSTTVTSAADAPRASKATVADEPFSPPTATSHFAILTAISSSAGRTETVVCPWARAAMCLAFASTLCTTDTYTSRFGALSAATGLSAISLVAFVSARMSVYASFSRSTDTSAQPANGARTIKRGVSPTR